MRWLAPWQPLADAGAFVDELRRECGWRHPLRGVPVSALAHRADRDDVLFQLEDGSGRVAVVHLTWRKETGARWPDATLLADLASFARTVMAEDHAQRDT
jgi:hypothetical protein